VLAEGHDPDITVRPSGCTGPHPQRTTSGTTIASANAASAVGGIAASCSHTSPDSVVDQDVDTGEPVDDGLCRLLGL